MVVEKNSLSQLLKLLAQFEVTRLTLIVKVAIHCDSDKIYNTKFNMRYTAAGKSM